MGFGFDELIDVDMDLINFDVDEIIDIDEDDNSFVELGMSLDFNSFFLMLELESVVLDIFIDIGKM